MKGEQGTGSRAARGARGGRGAGEQGSREAKGAGAGRGARSREPSGSSHGAGSRGRGGPRQAPCLLVFSWSEPRLVNEAWLRCDILAHALVPTAPPRKSQSSKARIPFCMCLCCTQSPERLPPQQTIFGPHAVSLHS